MDDFTSVLTEFLARKANLVADAVVAAIEDRLGKAEDPASAEAALGQPDWDWSELRSIAQPYITGMAVAAGEDAVSELGLFDDEVLDRMRVQATAFARDRAAELVGMRWVGEILMPNPDPKWTIANTTREQLKSVVVEALDEGWSPQKLKAKIVSSHSFSKSRAEMISRTELAIADVQGKMEGWRASKLVAGKQWDAAPGCCDECYLLDGTVVGLDEQFRLGAVTFADPPLHPNCRCDVSAVLSDEMPHHGDTH